MHPNIISHLKADIVSRERSLCIGSVLVKWTLIKQRLADTYGRYGVPLKKR